jgi:hypothetical protein
MALEPLAQQVAQVSTLAATGVEHSRPPVEAAPKQLVEEIDVDVAERVS